MRSRDTVQVISPSKDRVMSSHRATPCFFRSTTGTSGRIADGGAKRLRRTVQWSNRQHQRHVGCATAVVLCDCCCTLAASRRALATNWRCRNLFRIQITCHGAPAPAIVYTRHQTAVPVVIQLRCVSLLYPQPPYTRVRQKVQIAVS